MHCHIKKKYNINNELCLPLSSSGSLSNSRYQSKSSSLSSEAKRNSGSDGKYVWDKRAEECIMVSQGVLLINCCDYDAVADVV